ncbi:unnamed protein product [Effrenium voratum]|uniref:RING-type domain-containing protein n=1 Tax=Effrenium voratum TaxID=2562239 RepID=A0AA36JCE0_9DINO|nr:unnamed protein product [Effrenium voratum]CAJ1435894.1 unnamed protein product [Effrenium voratum]
MDSMDPMDPIFRVPLSFHNFVVLAVTLPVILWIAKVAYQLAMVVLIHHRLHLSRPICLAKMSIHAQEFQWLIRQHFNQILRMRRSVPAKQVPQLEVLVHLHPESLRLVSSEEEVTLEFTFDSSAPCCISVYWGLSPAAWDKLVRDMDQQRNRAMRSTSSRMEPAGGVLELGYQPPFTTANAGFLFTEQECAQRSSLYSQPAGCMQRFSIPAQDRSGSHAVVISTGEPRDPAEVTFLRCKEGSVEVLQQTVAGTGLGHRIQGVFGFEDEDAGEADCMVCYERLRSVIILPCRHCSVCSACLRSLRDERCPMCRSSFSAYLLLPLLRTEPAS